MPPPVRECGGRPTGIETSLKSDGYSRFGAQNRQNFLRPSKRRATARAPSLMSLEPAMRKLPADPQRGRVRHYAGWGRLESGKTGPPTASVGFASLAGLPSVSRTHGPQRIRRLVASSTKPLSDYSTVTPSAQNAGATDRLLTPQSARNGRATDRLTVHSA